MKKRNHALMEPGPYDIRLDAEGNVTEAVYSGQYYKITGYASEEEYISAGAEKNRVHPEDAERVRQAFEECLRQESGDFDIEYRLLTKNGYHRVHDHAKLLRAPDGSPCGLTGVIFDIEKFAVYSEELREKLLDMSHDIRTPLNAITGYVELLERLVPENMYPHVQYLEKIKTAGKQLLDTLVAIIEPTGMQGRTLSEEPSVPCEQDEMEMLFGTRPEELTSVEEFSAHLKKQNGAEAVVSVDDKVFRGRHVLLAEDNDLNAEIAIELLKGKGIETDWAKNGQECVDLLTAEQTHYDLILMDIRMPVMNGYEATRTIRRLPKPALAKIPIVALTANAFQEDILDAFEAGMNDHIAKPIDVDGMFRTIASVLA